MFPFYRMDIEIFQLKLRTMGGIKSSKMQTEFVCISDLKSTFCTSPAWKEDWPKVAMLLRSPEFKCLVFDEKENLNHKIGRNQLCEYVSKLEISVLALLWCSGTRQQKAKFLYQLAAPNSQTLLFDDPEMKFIFTKLLRFSWNLP